jgi:peptide/nickel transport system permease protein
MPSSHPPGSVAKQRDYPLLQGLILFLTAFYIFVGLVVDLLYAWLDPRLRRRG